MNKKKKEEDRRLIRYIFRLEDGREEQVDLEIDMQSLQLVRKKVHPVPHWADLDYFRCSHCPLDPRKTKYCPAALTLVGVVNSFDGTVSYDPVHLTVETEPRIITQYTTAQRAIGSLMGLLIALCGCPHSAFLRPMARFHLPLADEVETLYRATSMYLLGQYFIAARGGRPDLELTGLVKHYEQLQKVNFGLADRLREATRTDSSINAIVCLDVFTRTVPMAIAELLEEISPLFSDYLGPD